MKVTKIQKEFELNPEGNGEISIGLNSSSDRTPPTDDINFGIQEDSKSNTITESRDNSDASSPKYTKSKVEDGIYYLSMFLRYLAPVINLVSLIVLIIDKSHIYLVASAALSVIALGVENLGIRIRNRYVAHYREDNRKLHVAYATNLTNNVKELETVYGNYIDRFIDKAQRNNPAMDVVTMRETLSLENYIRGNFEKVDDAAISMLFNKKPVFAESKWLAVIENGLHGLFAIDQGFLGTSLYFKGVGDFIPAVALGAANVVLNVINNILDDALLYGTERKIKEETSLCKEKNNSFSAITKRLYETEKEEKLADDLAKIETPCSARDNPTFYVNPEQPSFTNRAERVPLSVRDMARL